MARPRVAALQDADLLEGRLGPIERFADSGGAAATATYKQVTKLTGQTAGE